ncbi:hypothetical protein L5515_005569 [Caenorhabditis briggsae]|uniref:Uncharacterized protein n=1 Tax=Caenorhabditis briggsae TaxID=6238 RepID=A0AAE9JDF7_CAEBR|nr:hypothetical protein L3Y34_002726 [Caenorhabditis briggsae]UMM25977.1 hypothetical protein L5515_005569 [Caenorhabditis briggsae]
MRGYRWHLGSRRFEEEPGLQAQGLAGFRDITCQEYGVRRSPSMVASIPRPIWIFKNTICQVGDDFKDSKKTRQDIRTPPGYQNYFELDFLCYFYIFVFSRVSVLVVCRVFRSSLLG